MCEDICDDCNWYFGSFGTPSIETVLKEAFFITQYKIYLSLNLVGKNKKLTRFNSIYFDCKKGNKIVMKPAFKLRANFIQNITRKFKRGIYKIFLEEIHRQHGIGYDRKFDFFKGFVRYDFEPELPIYILEFKHPIHILNEDFINKPEVKFDEVKLNKIEKYGIAEMSIWGHQFAIPVSQRFEYQKEEYFNHIKYDLSSLFGRIVEMSSILNLDMMLDRIKD